MAQQPFIKGRYASSLDEVRVAQIDFDGSKTYFVCPAINTIYAKSIDMNGNSLIEAYVLDRVDNTTTLTFLNTNADILFNANVVVTKIC